MWQSWSEAQMTFFIIFFVVLVLASEAQQQPHASGSGSGSTTENTTASPPPQLCLPLPSNHPCKNFTGRGSNHALPQMALVDVQIGIVVIQLGLAITSTRQTTDPKECREAAEYYICLLGAPPCDPVSDQPLLICDRNCKAYNMLIADGNCNDTMDAARQIAISFNNEIGFRLLELYEVFDCGSASTYNFYEVNMNEDINECTNLLSMESEERVLSQSQCIAMSSQACTALYPMPYFVPVEERLEGDIFAEVSTISIGLDRFCANALITFACAYLHPACNPERGTQLAVCPESCTLLQMINEKCSAQYSQIISQNSTKPFIQFLENFDCSNHQSYVIPGIPVDEEECISADDFFNIPEETLETSLHMSRAAYIASGTLGALLTMVLLIVIIVCVYCKKKLKKRYYRQWAFSLDRRNKPVRNKEVHEMQSESRPASVSTTDAENGEWEGEKKEVKLSQADVKKYESQFSGSVFHYDNLELKEIIGEGAFGKVYVSILNDPEKNMKDIEVAVKTIKNIHSEEQLKEFLAESLLMKDFHHPHIVGLLGVCFDTPHGLPYIILPFMANGSLKKYLKERRVHVLDINSYPKGLPLELLTHMCMDIAEGMKYLADNKFAHRDLAARNCMLNSELSVLVGDFGLARHIYASAYYRAGKNAKLPVKWMPPETLHDGISNEKTDVWSYGVTCWEVFSLGRTPYPGIENHEILEHISNGGRPKKPPLCPEKLYTIFSLCWQYLPEERPSFKEIVSVLKEYWDEEHFYMVQSFSR